MQKPSIKTIFVFSAIFLLFLFIIKGIRAVEITLITVGIVLGIGAFLNEEQSRDRQNRLIDKLKDKKFLTDKEVDNIVLGLEDESEE